jgi:hypothetical protein
MTIYSEFAADLAEIEVELGAVTFTYAGQSYPALRSDATDQETALLAATTGERVDFSLVVRNAALGAVRPKARKRIAIDGTEYEIARVQAGPAWQTLSIRAIE